MTALPPQPLGDPSQATAWLAPELLWHQGAMLRAMAVGIDAAGRVAALMPADALTAPAEALPRRALLPGFVNAHSHAFQRTFRGQTEYLQAGREAEDFWSWRAQMYEAAGRLDAQGVYDSALALYREARAAGYTAIGEFHYLHHHPDGRPMAPVTRLADAVGQAAIDAGVRLRLLVTLYHSGGIGQPIGPGQRRFAFERLEDYLGVVEKLLLDWEGHPRVGIGLAPHSIRAVPLDWLAALARWNRDVGLPVHMHLCEQPAEVASSRALLGAAPIEALASTGLLGPRLVAVHATHLEPDDPRRLAEAGACVCACPTTEANLGDGFLPASALLEAGVALSIGSDSHIVVNPFEELRLIENNERLQRRRRNVLAAHLPVDAAEPSRRRVAPWLLEVGTAGGADALDLACGRIAPGCWADFVEINLDDPSLASVPDAWLPEALVFSADTRAVAATRVGGKP